MFPFTTTLRCQFSLIFSKSVFPSTPPLSNLPSSIFIETSIHSRFIPIDSLAHSHNK